MFESFFPRPKLFFLSAAIYGLLAMIIWYYFGADLGSILGLPFPDPSEPKIIGLAFFITNNFYTFYLYFFTLAGSFALFWMTFSPHPWQNWSILGSIFIVFLSFIFVQFAVAVNSWFGAFYTDIQEALDPDIDVPASTLYKNIIDYLLLAWPIGTVAVLNSFFTSHYVFRWRTAMNDYYVSKWDKVRHIEGASQRIQEDTMRFASIVESLGLSIVDAIMTLFAFLPLLYQLSVHVDSIPFLGEIPSPLVYTAIFWAVFGTALMIVFGMKLPGLQFKNQRVEAAYRKELVYGEDSEDYASPPKLSELYRNVRKNYFRLYFHYTYFNTIKQLYARFDIIIGWFVLVPTIVAAKVSLGVIQQISAAFAQVTDSFQYLFKSWPTIIELLSIHKRLAAFEAAIEGEELPKIDQEYLAGKK